MTARASGEEPVTITLQQVRGSQAWYFSPTPDRHNCFVPDLLVLFTMLYEICNDTNQCHSYANHNCSDQYLLNCWPSSLNINIRVIYMQLFAKNHEDDSKNVNGRHFGPY